MPLTIRDFTDDDTQATARLFHDTVRTASGPAYDARQRAAWAPKVPDSRAWGARLAAATTLVAEDASGLAGFMSLERAGDRASHIEMAFVRADQIGGGVAKALYDALITRAQTAGLHHLSTDASAMARRFFERQGWAVIREQQPVRDGVALTNYRMELRMPG